MRYFPSRGVFLLSILISGGVFGVLISPLLIGGLGVLSGDRSSSASALPQSRWEQYERDVAIRYVGSAILLSVGAGLLTAEVARFLTPSKGRDRRSQGLLIVPDGSGRETGSSPSHDLTSSRFVSTNSSILRHPAKRSSNRLSNQSAQPSSSTVSDRPPHSGGSAAASPAKQPLPADGTAPAADLQTNPSVPKQSANRSAIACRVVPTGKSLQGANLRGQDLSAVELGQADLRNADLTSTVLVEGNLQRADLRGTTLNQADLSRANLREATLSQANLQQANLTDADLRQANLMGADLREARCEGANFHATICDRTTQFPSDLDLSEFTLYRLEPSASLWGVDLHRLSLVGLDLSGANLSEADLSEADLWGADLRGTDLTGALLVKANLSGAILAGANLTDADLTDADLTDADLTDAILTQAITEGTLLDASLVNARADV